ncbi:MAG: glycosyl transferase family 2 [Thermoleophilia bacterium]|nr:glycosyl transferase family 2 [Thermoleophilia bacterium]
MLRADGERMSNPTDTQGDPATSSQAPLTSIVILTRNELEVTRLCVESILRLTPEPFEFVFVDNGSTDGTVEYLRELSSEPADGAFRGAVVIENDRNLGFGGGCNQGIAASLGERVLLLNNDVVVTAGWLTALHRELDRGPHVGIAGPRSNNIAGVQAVPGVTYDTDTLDGLDAWADTFTADHAGASDAFVRLVGFCLLMERAVLDRIGGFDLRFGLGNFEDDDICIRTGVAGFECRIAHDSFIHHFGSRTFTAERIDWAATMAANQARFATKWQLRPEEDQFSVGSYRADLVIQRTSFDPDRHGAPVIGVPDAEATAELGATRSHVLLACADRLDPQATTASLTAALTAFGPDDDVTVCIRIDPRDDAGYAALDALADALGDAALPDVVLVESSDENDLPVLRAVDAVIATGRMARSRAQLARRVGVIVTSPESVTTTFATLRAA